MSRKAIFLYVKNFLLKQGRPSKELNQPRRARARGQPPREPGQCYYRMPYLGRTLKCAVGCLIPESKYSYNLEGYSLTSTGTVQAVLQVSEAKRLMLKQLQDIHDNAPTNPDGSFLMDDLMKSLSELWTATFGEFPSWNQK